MSKSKDLETLKLKPTEKETITAFLETKAGRPERRRAARRCQFTDPAGLIIRVKHPGGTVVPCRVTPRDLSDLGMGFLHGNFLYPGSTCRFDLRRQDGQSEPIVARIARCDHITGRVHHIGIEFAEAIDITQFADIEAEAESTEPASQKPTTKPAYWIKK